MIQSFPRFRCAFCALANTSLAIVVVCGLSASHATATTVSFSGTSSDGHAVSGTAGFTLGAGTANVTLTNTTTTTHDAGELFTGLDFSLGGLTPTLSTKTGIERTVAGSGSFTDTATAQNITWSLVSLGSGKYQLNFNPDATDAILGPPTSGSYASANNSIDGNNGHNPFVAQTASFVLNVPGLTTTTSLSVTAFRFGTALDAANGTTHTDPEVPEPSTAVLMLTAIAITSIQHLRHRARK
jgi:hypothetical protein